MGKISSKYPGIRYREHAVKKIGRVPDRYVFIRYKVNGRLIEEGFGWASQGFGLERAHEVLCILRQNHRTGTGPQTLRELREMAEAERQAQAEAEATARRDIPATIGDLYDVYIVHARASKKSWKSDQQIYKSRLRALADLLLTDITPGRITSHRQLLAQAYSPASVRHALGLLRRMVRWGAEHYARDWPDGIPSNPLLGVAMPRVSNQRLRYLRRHEADALLSWLAEHDPTIHDIALLGLYTGMRRGEIVELLCGHIDLSAKIISIVDPKSGATRETVSIPDVIVPMLTSRMEGRPPGGLLFRSNVTGRQIHAISLRFSKAVDAIGLNDGIDDPRYRITFHSLRHTYISWLVMAGVDIRTVQEMARHRSFEMTLRYAHLAPRARQSAANLLAGFSDS